MLGLWIALGVLGAVIVFGVIPTFIVAVFQFRKQLVRTDKRKWGRECSWPDDAEQVEMYRRGDLWGEANKDKMTEVDIVNDGFHLFGQYFDFGFDRAVIIIPGRMEGCTYSYYFAKPYPENGYNVLVIDNRSHGLSDGRYNALGLKEYSDILAWGRLLHEQKGNKEVFLHGICIGSATAIQTLTAKNVPDYFTGMVADGMYTTFRESFKNHILDLKHPLFPVLGEVMLLIKIFAGVDVTHDGPIYRVDKLKKPILMIYTRQDKFSTPADAEKLYSKCTAPKRIAWFEHGKHSHVRINNEEGYDSAVAQFLKDKDSLTAGA